MLNAIGLDAHRFYDVAHNPSRRLALTLQAIGAETVLDVGAHRGEFALGLRRCGFTGSILSFEPDSRSFPVLRDCARRDHRWSAFQFACGNHDGQETLHLSQNEVSSSLHPATDLHVRSAPASVQLGTQPASVRRLDRWIEEFGLPDVSRTFVKVDVQGSEMDVLEGLGGYLGQLAGLQLEVSFRPLYDAGARYMEVLNSLDRLGYLPSSVTPVFLDSATGICMQADITFVRSEVDPPVT